jgi:hypothetical protein
MLEDFTDDALIGELADYALGGDLTDDGLIDLTDDGFGD